GAHRETRYKRRADPRVRVPRPLLEPRLRDQGVRDRPRGRDPLRRDGDPSAARALADGAAREVELVAAGLDAARPVHPGEGAGAGAGSRRLTAPVPVLAPAPSWPGAARGAPPSRTRARGSSARTSASR